MFTPQKTIKVPVQFSGTGLHNGKISEISIHPAPTNFGIVFEKILEKKSVFIKTDYRAVDSTLLCTSLTDGNEQIGTVEHLLSAFYALGIDNALIKVKGDEIPIMDGSSALFVFGFNQIGLVEQEENKKYLKVKKKIMVEYQDCYATLEPWDGFELSFEINYDHPFIQKTQCQYSIDLLNATDDYVKQIAKARTFGFIKDKQWLRDNNLAIGASIDNVVVIGDSNIDAQQKLRNKAEFVQHKLLDAIGDLSLCGFNLMAKYHGYKAGHKLNNQLLHQLFSDKNNYQIL